MTLLRGESCLMSWWLAQVGHGWDYTYYLDCISHPMIDLKLLFPNFTFLLGRKPGLLVGSI